MNLKRFLFYLIVFQARNLIVLGNIIQDEVHVSDQTENIGYNATTQENGSSTNGLYKNNNTNSQKSYEYDDSNLWNFANQIFLKGLGDGKKSNIIQFNNSNQPVYYVLELPTSVKNNNSTNNSKTFPKFVYSNEIFYTPGYNPVVGYGSGAPRNGSGKVGIRAAMPVRGNPPVVQYLHQV